MSSQPEGQIYTRYIHSVERTIRWASCRVAPGWLRRNVAGWRGFVGVRQGTRAGQRAALSARSSKPANGPRKIVQYHLDIITYRTFRMSDCMHYLITLLQDSVHANEFCTPLTWTTTQFRRDEPKTWHEDAHCWPTAHGCDSRRSWRVVLSFCWPCNLPL